jgi:hypothetical protein
MRKSRDRPTSTLHTATRSSWSGKRSGTKHGIPSRVQAGSTGAARRSMASETSS